MSAHEYTVVERTQNQFTTKPQTKKNLTQRRKDAKVRRIRKDSRKRSQRTQKNREKT
jgi:hypothetical protein